MQMVLAMRCKLKGRGDRGDSQTEYKDRRSTGSEENLKIYQRPVILVSLGKYLRIPHINIG